METMDDRRRRKLRALCEEHGIKRLAAKAGVSWANLDQIIKEVVGTGMENPKSLSTATARKIEDAYDLGRGWFDWPFDGVDHQRYYSLSATDQAIVQGEMKHAIKDCEERAGKRAAA